MRSDKRSVFDHLTQPDKFVSVHPLIYKMTDLGGGNYKVYERVKFGPIPYKFTYKANIATRDIDEVIIKASVAGLTKIEMHFFLDSFENSTTINEHISVSTPLPVKRYMYRLLEEQHRLLFQNIEKNTEKI
ncbi:MAG: hypothetical protein KF685_06205 [Acidobacteria bacterium]|nr:hypothetical protein [Acidobacteriota bacterium]